MNTPGHCQATGKIMLLDRASARKLARQHPDHMHEYRCDACGHYHIGHLAPAVIRGILTRSDIYQPVTHARSDDQQPELSVLDELRAARELLRTVRRRVRGISRDDAIARLDAEIRAAASRLIGA